jgi:hypothetical protein
MMSYTLDKSWQIRCDRPQLGHQWILKNKLYYGGHHSPAATGEWLAGGSPCSWGQWAHRWPRISQFLPRIIDANWGPFHWRVGYCLLVQALRRMRSFIRAPKHFISINVTAPGLHQAQVCTKIAWRVGASLMRW